MKLLYPDNDGPPIHFRFTSTRRSWCSKEILTARQKKNSASFLPLNKSIRETPAGTPPVKFLTRGKGNDALLIKSLLHFAKSIFCLTGAIHVGEMLNGIQHTGKTKSANIFQTRAHYESSPFIQGKSMAIEK